MKKIALFALALLFLMSFFGCSKTPSGTETTEAPFESGSQAEAGAPTSSVAPSEKNGLASLRENICDAKCLLGVGFLGYIDSESDEASVRGFVADCALAKSYPFLKEISPVLSEGAELYAFVPANDGVCVTVYRSRLTEEGSLVDDRNEPLFVGKGGEIAVLRCNISEVYPNVLISVTDGETSLEFRPTVSLENGKIVRENGCYDFSVYPSPVPQVFVEGDDSADGE